MKSAALSLVHAQAQRRAELAVSRSPEGRQDGTKPQSSNNRLYVRLKLRQAELRAAQIVQAHGMNRRMIRTLAVHMVAEALDLRAAQLRRVVNRKRRAVSMNTYRWCERRENDPALDWDVQDAVEALRCC